MARVTFVNAARKDQGKCDFCGEPVTVGQSYQWIAPRPSGYGKGTKRVRHSNHPSWHVWEYSNSLSARLAQIDHDARNSFTSLGDFTEESDFQSMLSEVSEAIRSLAEEKREGAENIEAGFGHPTSMSEELAETADSLESWAEEFESADVPELPEPDEEECEECEDGQVDGETCEECDGEGTKRPDEPTEDQYDEWRGECESKLDELLGNCPV